MVSVQTQAFVRIVGGVLGDFFSRENQNLIHVLDVSLWLLTVV